MNKNIIAIIIVVVTEVAIDQNTQVTNIEKIAVTEVHLMITPQPIISMYS
jgi:hypothetical protein